MATARPTSQEPTDRKRSSVKGGRPTSLLEQIDIEHLIEQEVLHAVAEYDPKLDFHCVPIFVHDQVLKHRCRQTYGLLWNVIRSANVSRLVPYDRSSAFVEILHIPANWSRYDKALLLHEIRHQKFLNGLALRDELVRVLQIVLKRDFQQNAESLYEFDALQFTRNSIHLTFHCRGGSAMTLMVTLILLVEFDVPCTTFFPDTYRSLCEHGVFREYFQKHPDVQQTHLTPSNSIKFRFDSNLIEVKLCDYLVAQSTSLSCMWKNLLKLRKQSLKHVPRAVKHAIETSRKLPHLNQLCVSPCPLNPEHSTTSNIYGMTRCYSIFNREHSSLESPHADLSLSAEIEEALEFLFSIPLLRLLFLTACSNLKAIPSEHDIDTAHVIVDTLQSLAAAVESSYLAHPFSKNTNVFAEFPLTCDKRAQLGIAKLIDEIQRDWKRSIVR